MKRFEKATVERVQSEMEKKVEMMKTETKMQVEEKLEQFLETGKMEMIVTKHLEETGAFDRLMIRNVLREPLNAGNSYAGNSSSRSPSRGGSPRVNFTSNR